LAGWKTPGAREPEAAARKQTEFCHAELNLIPQMKKQSRKYFLPQRNRRVTIQRKFFFLEKQEEVKKLFYSTINKSIGQCAVFSFALFFTHTDKKENRIFHHMYIRKSRRER
jgi:hypothetical protein